MFLQVSSPFPFEPQSGSEKSFANIKKVVRVISPPWLKLLRLHHPRSSFSFEHNDLIVGSFEGEEKFISGGRYTTGAKFAKPINVCPASVETLIRVVVGDRVGKQVGRVGGWLVGRVACWDVFEARNCRSFAAI